MTVIDSHFHWFPRALYEYICEIETFPRVVRNGNSYTETYGPLESKASPIRDESNARDTKWFDLDLAFEKCHESYGDDFKVVLSTGVLTGLLGQIDPRDALNVAQTFNEAIAETQRENKGILYGTAVVPLHDAELAAKVAEQTVRDFGFVGVNLPAMSHEDFVDTPRLEPFFAKMEELQVPLIIHPNDVAYGRTFPDYAGAIHVSMGRLLDSSLTTLRLILGGFLDRYPELKIMVTHGGGLLPYQAGRLDKNARVPSLPLPPSTYLKKIYVDTVSPIDITIRTAIEYFGNEHVLYGSDYPCWNLPAARGVIEDSHLDAETHDRVLSGNAHALFNI